MRMLLLFPCPSGGGVHYIIDIHMRVNVNVVIECL